MIFETNKQRGNAGLSMAIAYFGSNGYIVSLPLNDTQDYDLIADDGEKLLKVQCKSTQQIINKDKGIYTVELSSCGGTKGVRYKTIKDTNVDLVFVLCSDNTMYLIPKDKIVNVRGIRLYKHSEDISKYIPKTTRQNVLDTSKYIINI